MKILKIAKIAVPIVLLVFAVIMSFIIFFNSPYDAKTNLEDLEMAETAAGTGYFAITFFIILSIVGIVARFVLNAITDFKSVVKFLIGTGVVLIILLIAYSMATNDLKIEKQDYFTSFFGDSSSKMIGGIITTTFILLILSIFSMIGATVVGIIKR